MLQPVISSLCVSLLSCILSLTSTHLGDHPLGQPVVNKILSPRWMRKTESFLSGSHTDLVLMTMKLVHGISTFAGGKEKRTLLESFIWDVKVSFIQCTRVSKAELPS